MSINDPRKAAEVHVEFFIDAMEDANATREAGRPIFKDVEKVRIRFPGDPKRELVTFANDVSDRDRETGRQITYAEAYPLHYRAFREANYDLVEGTPLSELPFLSRSKVRELQALNIKNAEQLAALDERTFKRVGMGARELVDKTKRFLAETDKDAEITALEDRNRELEERLSRLEGMMQSGGEDRAEPRVKDDEDLGPGTDFENWEPETIKAFIKDVSGKAPSGTPKFETLVQMARDAYRAAKARKEAAEAA